MGPTCQGVALLQPPARITPENAVDLVSKSVARFAQIDSPLPPSNSPCSPLSFPLTNPSRKPLGCPQTAATVPPFPPASFSESGESCRSSLPLLTLAAPPHLCASFLHCPLSSPTPNRRIRARPKYAAPYGNSGERVTEEKGTSKPSTSPTSPPQPFARPGNFSSSP